ncbi:MAG: DUF3893 domain-containing protein [Hormoscilla sp. GUM202]|nr:DUF3893 domain-containing protein [Hormoscilla sp. GUM202]
MTETTLPAKTLYIPLGNPKSIEVMPLAFTVPDDLPPVTVEGFTLAWTKTALLNLAEIQKATITKNNRDKGKNIPYASLRSLLEIGLDNAARIHSSLGLSFFALHGKNNNEPNEPEKFAYLSGGRADTIRRTLRPILNDWITNFLSPFAEREEAPIDRLLDLQESDELLEITPLRSQILPWRWSKETGTTRPRDNYDYRVLVDYVAREIAGQEIFRGLGPMKRIISSSRSFTTGITELITDPITLKGCVGKFSLVLQLELVTYPSLHQPLLKIDVSKRRWLNQLKDPGFDFGKISGFVFNTSYADRAFLYYVLCQQKKNESSYQTDQDFEVLRRKLLLPMKTSDGRDIDGQQIALGKASTESSQVLLTHRNGLPNEKHDIKVGVPEIDKLEAFEAIVGILEPLGFQAFDAYKQVKFKRGTGHKIDEDTASRRINLPTLLTAALENAEGTVPSDCQAQYINELNERELDSKLKKSFDINLDQIKGGRKALTSKSDQINELKKLIERNQEAMGHLHSQEQPVLVIFYEDDLQADVKLLQAIVRVLWGETIKVMINRLPQNTHGPRKLLPGASLKGQARSQQRIEAWEPIAKEIAAQKPKTFCLIMAKIFYSDSEDENAIKRDDRVNKPSTRQALARAGACVQFIQPIEKSKKNKLDLEDFLFRVQASLEDLLLAHSGYIHKVQEKVDKWIDRAIQPKEIIAITIVRKQKGRARGRIEQTFLPIATRIKVETGECELCCAYERGNRLEVSPWSKFSDALGAIAQISPVKLADKENIRKERFMTFVKDIISSSVEEGNQPLVMIDSSNCVRLWSWLADSRINANNIEFKRVTGSPLYENMSEEWQGARIIRIRQELAPGIIEKKVRELAETTLEDTRTKKELTPTYRIPSASSPMELFRLNVITGTNCSAYLSVGRKTLQQEFRGQSCYRGIEKPVPLKRSDAKEKVKNQAGLDVHELTTIPPFTDQWPTPNPLEIVVTLRQPGDDCDRLAALVESLRYGFGHYREWTSLPAPLFFERVVRDYISAFTLSDEEDEAEED